MLSFRVTASGSRVRLAAPPRWGTILGLAVGAVSCRPSRTPVPPLLPAAAHDECALAEDSVRIPDTLTLALPGGVDPAHAPVPETDAERMVFRQLYETLVRLDCTGAPRPGLAQAWSASDSGVQWTFTLRAGARFQDGQAVTARDVVASWMSGDTTLLEGATVTAPDDRTLVLRLRHPSAAPPLWLADPALAVTRAMAGESWPEGTGSYAVDSVAGGVVLTPLGGRRPTLQLPRLGVGDARDWLDRGIDLVVTGDAAALGYAASRPELMTEALPWDRTYLLLAPGAAPPVTTAWREGLARDAVRVEARAAEAPAWWTAFPACIGPAPTGAPPLRPEGPRFLVAYPREDATARSIAERLVALEGAQAGTTARAAALGPAELMGALAAGQPGGGGWQFVIPFPQVVLEPCRAVHGLVARAPWLTLASQIVPLIETRRRVVWRRGAAAFTVDWDGTLRVR
jgi:extracellular solute-binding protein (family 5)